MEQEIVFEDWRFDYCTAELMECIKANKKQEDKMRLYIRENLKRFFNNVKVDID